LKVVIAGSRDVFDFKILQSAIDDAGFDITEVVCGDAPGMDKCGECWAKQHEIPVKHFPAEWGDLDAPNALIRENSKGKYNARAGFDRNVKIAEYADAAIVITNGEDRGCLHLIEQVENLEKQTYIWEI